MLNKIVSTEMIRALNPTLGNAPNRSLFEPMPNPREKIRMTMIANEALSSFTCFLFRSK